jgi:hypothetical protein
MHRGNKVVRSVGIDCGDCDYVDAFDSCNVTNDLGIAGVETNRESNFAPRVGNRDRPVAGGVDRALRPNILCLT